MKITYVTHSCIMVKIANTVILTDPWLTGPCWGGDLWHFPKHNFNLKTMPKPDIIFFSHGHDDHFHENSIKNFPKAWMNSLIIAPKFGVSWWENEVNKKFNNSIFFNHNEKKILKGIEFQIFINDKGDFDSSLKIKKGSSTVFFQTDNLMSFKEADRISKLGKIDFAFLMPFQHGCYPGFFKMSLEEKIKELNKKTLNSMDYSANICKRLSANYTIPYACDLAHMGKNFFLNFIDPGDKKNYLNYLTTKKLKTKGVILNSGDCIIKKDKKVVINKTPYNHRDNKFLDFYNKNYNEYNSLIQKDAKIKRIKLLKAPSIFKKKLKDNLGEIKPIKFFVKLKILDTNSKKNTSIILDLNKKLFLKKRNKLDLIIEIQNNKIANLLDGKYPMNFLTFHNGGFIAERFTKNYSNKEKQFWNWIYNIQF